MKIYNRILLQLVFVVIAGNLSAQTFAGLHALNKNGFKVFYSQGHEERAKNAAQQVDRAMKYYEKILDFRPDVTLLVLSPEDWSKHTKFPVYGMPHYNNEKTLVVASSDNPFWKSFIPPADQIPEALATKVKKAYGNSDGSISMQPFFDLLALHELGHAYHMQGGLVMQRKWMGELFSNMMLHTFIAEKQPRMLAALTVFPKMVVAFGTSGYSYTTLDQFEQNYEQIATSHPKNYGWYQSRLHVAAQEIYDVAGRKVLQKLWRRLKSEKKISDNTELAKFLSSEVHSAVSDVMFKW